MLPIKPTPHPGAASRPLLSDAVKNVIVHRMQRHDPPQRIAALIADNFQIQVDREQMLACWYERKTPPTQAEPRQVEPTQAEPRPDKESIQLPADQPGEPLFTSTPCAETPDRAPPYVLTEAAPSTRTGPGQIKESMQIPPEPAQDRVNPCMAPASQDAPSTRTGPGQEEDIHEILPAEVREYIIERMARHDPLWLIAEHVERKFAFVPDRDEIMACWLDRDALPTRTGPGPEKASVQKLSDEVKEFIVKRIACYQPPSRIAAAVRLNFGIDIDRRRVFDYDPAGSRPPAQRWIDLHAATRARFNRDKAEIGIAQQVVRLRMLDRFARMAEESHQHERAAKFLQQAARECGGFYEKRKAPPASPAAASGPDACGN